jgi:hypothetical protein
MQHCDCGIWLLTEVRDNPTMGRTHARRVSSP